MTALLFSFETMIYKAKDIKKKIKEMFQKTIKNKQKKKSAVNSIRKEKLQYFFFTFTAHFILQKTAKVFESLYLIRNELAVNENFR